mmetsp:Transcript_24945/g.34928  ORF Transcript_24945/g.34928 Transcript_24945/m.34928 type:complete len:654 (+) Transcript_24945:87-2048(+)
MANTNNTKFWTTDPSEDVPIRYGKDGLAALPAQTAIQALQGTVKRYGNKLFLSQRKDANTVRRWTWQEYYDSTMRFARACIHIGLKPAEAVGIIGFNSPEWFISDLGAIAAGGVACGIYTTNGPEACQYVAENSESAIVVCEDERQLKKFLQIRDKLPKLKALVQWTGTPPNEKDVYSWDAFMQLGGKEEEEEVQRRISNLKPGQCCTYIYTSGTTGMPKGVMLSHDNITWTAKAVITMLGITAEDSMVSYLPLSHVAAQMLDLHGPIASGLEVHFAQPDALKGSLVATLKDVRPTLFLGVPRVWEKIQEKMVEVGKNITGWKKSLSDWAKQKGLEGSYAEQKGQDKPWGWFIANKVVFENVKKELGLDRIKMCGSGAAPISLDTLNYFLSLYIPIFEIYGMSECTGPETVNYPGHHKTGTAGVVMSGTELKIDNPDKDGNGEVIWRGRNVFIGYVKNEKATSEAIDAEGWLHSGDVGKVDSEGFLTITGRIKELLITAGGENIPPVIIENEILKEIGSVVSNVIVIGDRKKFLSAIVTLKAVPKKEVASQHEYPFTDELDKSVIATFAQLGTDVTTVSAAAKDPKVKQFIHEGIAKANKRAISNAQVIQKFFIASEDFTLETGELTPTMKLKRRVVVDKYNTQIEELYNVAE